MSNLCLDEDSAAGVVSNDRRQSQFRQDECDRVVRSVFTTPDLLLGILLPLVDGGLKPNLFTLPGVSKSFRDATSSDEFWREMCYQRWKGKWGFRLRWERALEDHSNVANQQLRQNQDKFTNFWKFRYLSEEQDATRNFILVEELESLVFDFRFWIGQPTTAGDGSILVKSGLLESASREFKFSMPTRDGGVRSEEESAIVPPYSVRGHIAGHPCSETGIEWFLDESGGRIRWGFVPNLWPQGIVHRMDNWGWQIHNKNVVLRSIDNVPSPTILDPSDCDTFKLAADYSSSNVMWKDLLDSLENVPISIASPLGHGSIMVSVEIPRLFFERNGL